MTKHYQLVRLGLLAMLDLASITLVVKPAKASHWQGADLTTLTGGPSVSGVAIATAFDPVWNGMRTHYVAADRYVHELFLSAGKWQDVLEAWESVVALSQLEHAAGLLPADEGLAFHTRLLEHEHGNPIKSVMERYQHEKAILRPKRKRLLAMLKRLIDVEPSTPRGLTFTDIPSMGGWETVAKLLTKLSGER